MKALDFKIFLVFFLKTIFDASSRLTIFGAWMFTFTNGMFSTKLSVAYYYSIALLMIIVNYIFFALEEAATEFETLKSFEKHLGMTMNKTF